MMNFEVREIMDKNPKTADPNMNAAELSSKMLAEGIQQMPVVFEDKLVGLITVHDLWKQYKDKTTLSALKVSDVMNTNILKISPKDKVGTAAELFADKRFKSLLVVNLDNKLKGVVTAFDIIKIVFNEEYNKPIIFKEEFSM